MHRSEAEIDIIDGSADELAALVVEVPSRRRCSGALHRRRATCVPRNRADPPLGVVANGRSVLRSFERARRLPNPFLTVLVVADWGRGRVLRDSIFVHRSPRARAASDTAGG
jgi:hypothetical protein